MKTAVLTVVAGRHDHLRHQLRHLGRSSRHPDVHLVVSMGDPEIPGIVTGSPVSAETLTIAVEPGALPLARARNLAAAGADLRGAELLIFLDVDCIPHPRLVDRYRAAAQSSGTDALLCGPVTYLSRNGTAAVHGSPTLGLPLPDPHPARPVLADRTVERGGRHDLFWSLSFAVLTSTWRSIGGFCEEYAGYGGEDTDFAQCAAAAGVDVVWVGGADAFHQYHPVSDPPVEHLDDILRNATVFHRRWGRWPMEGWLRAFESAGLIRYDPAAAAWLRSSASPRYRGGSRRHASGRAIP